MSVDYGDDYGHPTVLRYCLRLYAAVGVAVHEHQISSVQHQTPLSQQRIHLSQQQMPLPQHPIHPQHLIPHNQ